MRNKEMVPTNTADYYCKRMSGSLHWGIQPNQSTVDSHLHTQKNPQLIQKKTKEKKKGERKKNRRDK